MNLLLLPLRLAYLGLLLLLIFPYCVMRARRSSSLTSSLAYGRR